jgi:uncharacterized membrane protein YfcA
VTLAEIVTVLVTVLLAAVVQNTAGFGFALMAVPLMSVVVDTHVAVIISTVLGLGSSAAQAWIGRADTDRPIARRMTFAALAGMPFGLVVFKVVDSATLRLVVGVCVLVIVVLLARRLDLRHAGPHLDVVAGGISGVLATSVSTNGPPLVFALQARHIAPDVFRPTINTVFCVSGLVSLTLFTATGEVTAAALIGVAAALPSLGLGVVLGHRLRLYVSGERFRVMVLVLLALAGAMAVVAGLRG